MGEHKCVELERIVRTENKLDALEEALVEKLLHMSQLIEVKLDNMNAKIENLSVGVDKIVKEAVVKNSDRIETLERKAISDESSRKLYGKIIIASLTLSLTALGVQSPKLITLLTSLIG